MADHNTPDSVSRRNVLKTAGGALTTATLLAGRGAATGEDSLRFEVEDANEEVIIANVTVPPSVEIPDNFEFAQDTYLGLAGKYIVREDAVRLPENAPEVLATPAEVERLDSRTYRMVFRIRDIHWPEEYEGEKIPLGLGLFHSHTIIPSYFDVSPIDPVLWCGVKITYPPDDTTWGNSVPTRVKRRPQAKLTFKATSTGIRVPPTGRLFDCHNNWTLKWDYRYYEFTNGQLQPQSWVKNVKTGSPIALWLKDDQCGPTRYDVRVRAVTNQGTVVASDTNKYRVSIVSC